MPNARSAPNPDFNFSRSSKANKTLYLTQELLVLHPRREDRRDCPPALRLVPRVRRVGLARLVQEEACGGHPPHQLDIAALLLSSAPENLSPALLSALSCGPPQL